MFLPVCGSVNRSYIDDLFLTRITESLVDEGQHPQNRQQNSQHGDRFHVFCLFIPAGSQPSPHLRTIRNSFYFPLIPSWVKGTHSSVHLCTVPGLNCDFDSPLKASRMR